MRKELLRVIVLCSLLLISAAASPQDNPAISPYITLQYLNVDNQSSLRAELKYSGDNGDLPLPGMEISFYSTAGGKKLLARSVTDGSGVANFSFGDDIKIPLNASGTWSFNAESESNDTIAAASSDIEVMDVDLEVSFTEVDSIKTVSVSATTMVNGRKIPVTGEVVKVSVPRMFAPLTVNESTLDDNGTASFEFPPDIPGDSIGNLKIIASFEENPKFGNVEKTSVQKWGIPTAYYVPTTHRALWTKTAPRWMIYTLSVLLVGVWGHYLFAVISLILINIDARRKKAKDEYRL